MIPLSLMTGPELRDTLQRAAVATDNELPDGSLFIILAFDDSKIGQYVSNANRGDIIKVLREVADRMEQRQITEVVPFNRRPT